MYQRRRASRSQRKAVKYNNVDKQILAIHQAMGNKLLSRPDLVTQVKNTLEQRYQAGTMRYGAYLSWLGVLELIDTPEAFMQQLLDPGDAMCQLRRATPFVGLLSEDERQQALDALSLQQATLTAR